MSGEGSPLVWLFVALAAIIYISHGGIPGSGVTEDMTILEAVEHGSQNGDKRARSMLGDNAEQLLGPSEYGK